MIVDLPFSALLLIIVGILLLTVYIINQKRKQTANYKVTEILKPYIKDETKEFIIPDGIGGILEIEHLILLDQGFLLIQIYPMAGNIFGAENIEQWSQIIAGKSFKFYNPLRHMRTLQQALQALAPEIPIFSRIIFTDGATFPKGKPEEVSVLESLSLDLEKLKESPVIVEQSTRSWDRVMRIARKDNKPVKDL